MFLDNLLRFLLSPSKYIGGQHLQMKYIQSPPLSKIFLTVFIAASLLSEFVHHLFLSTVRFKVLKAFSSFWKEPFTWTYLFFSNAIPPGKCVLLSSFIVCRNSDVESAVVDMPRVSCFSLFGQINVEEKLSPSDIEVSGLDLEDVSSTCSTSTEPDCWGVRGGGGTNSVVGFLMQLFTSTGGLKGGGVVGAARLVRRWGEG
mmetsp:Transcript_355/g.860  ORF Transcript_355/g.860 Transcript_355/m.860 type:complete len:201 (+) Transcript_355:1048-1650(+)